MRKFLLLLLSVSFLSTLAVANETETANVGSDEDTFQQTAAPQVAAPAPVTSTDEELTSVAVEQETKTVEPQATTVAIQEPVKPTQTVQSPIDINGNYNARPAPQVAKRPLTEADKMRLMRARLEKQNEILVKKQMERMRLKQELEMSKRIQKTFDDSMKKLDEVE